jgi:Dolichyl-phosphate-mannose-protein mannosyltransferase
MKGIVMSLTEMLGSIHGLSRRRLARTACEAYGGRRYPPARFFIICACLFSVALGTRILCWQDNYVELLEKSASLQGLAFFYHDEARRMDDDGGYLFPRKHVDPGDARMLIHPPGYPILMTAFFKMSGEPDKKSRLADADWWMRVVQIITDSVASAVVFVIASELLPLAVATIAGLLVGLSPHLAYYSLLVAPDSLAVLPILLAVYFVIRASRRPRLITVLAAGAMVGLSCWLRSNALLLVLFLAVVLAVVSARGKRLSYSLALVGAAVIIIAPVTFRNWVVYQRFVPLSLGAGITMMEGVAIFDKEGKFDLAANDTAARLKDVEWYGRPDYGDNLWVPDGIERDRARMRRALQAVRSEPIWFFRVMLRRMAFMLRYNDFEPQETLFTTIAPAVLASPNFGHKVELTGAMPPAWSNSAAELMASGTIISPGAKAWLDDDHALEILSDNSNYGDQFASALIPVRENTDYVMRLEVELEQGPMEIKVGTTDPRIDLASMPAPETEKKRSAKKETEANNGPASDNDRAMTEVKLHFASADREQVRLVFYNNGASPAPKSMRVGVAEMFEAGPTPNQWTRLPRALVRGAQKNIFKTGLMRSLILIGVCLLALAGRGRELLIVGAVPAYYLLAQSAFHTEYRYILAIHYFLFVMAAVALYSLAVAIWQGARHAYGLAKRKNAQPSSGSTGD